MASAQRKGAGPTRPRRAWRWLGRLEAAWKALRRQREPATVTMSHYVGVEPDRRPVAVLTFTLEDRGVDWGPFIAAIAAAERALAEGTAGPASLRLNGVRIEIHPSAWTLPAEARRLDHAMVVEAFKMAKRTP